MKKLFSILLAVVMMFTMFALSSCNSEPTFKTPEERYEYVVNKEVNAISNPVLTQYSKAVESANNKKTTAQIGVEVGSGLKNVLKTMLSIDLDSLNSLDLKLEATVGSKKSAESATLLVNKTEVASIDAFTESETGKMIAKIPLLYDGFISMYNGDDQEKTTMINIPDFKKVIDALPTKDELNAIISKYVGVFLSKTKSVSVEDVDYTVGSLSEKAKSIKTTYSAADLGALVKEVLEKLKADESIKGIITRISTVVTPETPNSAYEAFVQKLDDTILIFDDIDEEAIADNKVDVELLTNNKNELLGFVLKVTTKDTVIDRTTDEAENMSSEITETLVTTALSAGYLETKDKYAFNVSAVRGEETLFKADSEGTKNNDCITGKVNVTASGKTQTFDIKDLDVKAMKNGEFSGEISMSISGIVSDFVNLDIMPDEVKDLANSTLIIKGKATSEAVDMSVELKGAKESYLTITFKAGFTTAADFTVPTDSVPMEEVLSDPDVINNASDKLIAKLKESGLSEDLVALLSSLLGVGVEPVRVEN